MIRLILILILIIFAISLFRPFLKTKESNKTRNKINKILLPNKVNFRQTNSIFLIIIAIFLFVLFLWLLPKFGVNVVTLLQKIVPIIFSLRNILPF